MFVYDGSGNAVQGLTLTGGDATPDVTIGNPCGCSDSQIAGLRSGAYA